MVETQIRDRGVRDERILQAMNTVPRERFLPVFDKHAAYEDRALSIGHGQTISQPFIVAYMTDQLRILPHHRVLEIGTGSGYQTAILARLCGHVYTVERLESLQRPAAEILGQLEFTNISFHVADGSLGWPEHAPYDRILSTASSPRVPMPLVEQLAPDGLMVLPVGMGDDQTIVRVFREGTRVVEIPLLGCRFVPLIGEAAWPVEG